MSEPQSASTPVQVRAGACTLCGGANLRDLPVPGHWIGPEVFAVCEGKLGLSRCNDCDYTFVNPRPSPELLNAFYTGFTYGCHSGEMSLDIRKKALFLLDFVAKHTDGRRILDYGCGGGFFLRQATAEKWDAVGYDIGAAGLASCRAQGLKVTDDLAELGRAPFDAVILNHVFEHIEDQDAVLGKLAHLLAPGGRLFIECPNADSLRARMARPTLSRNLPVDERYRAFPIHLSYFSPTTLARRLEKNRFRVVATETFGLGLDEFLVRPEAPPAPPIERAAADGASGGSRSRGRNGGQLRKAVKTQLKRWFSKAGLGENVMVVAER